MKRIWERKKELKLEEKARQRKWRKSWIKRMKIKRIWKKRKRKKIELEEKEREKEKEGK